MTEKSRNKLHGYVTDMLAVETELHNAFRRQKEDDGVRRFPVAHEVITETEEIIDQHIAGLRDCAESLGGESAMKNAVGGLLGMAAGLYDKVRPDATVSRMLRDDYTALSFAVVCSEMLHTTALSMGDRRIAELALSHIKDYAPLIMNITQALPTVLVSELAEEHETAINASAAEEAVRNTTGAWEEASRPIGADV